MGNEYKFFMWIESLLMNHHDAGLNYG
jgi:hypothetical protein